MAVDFLIFQMCWGNKKRNKTEQAGIEQYKHSLFFNDITDLKKVLFLQIIPFAHHILLICLAE